MEMASYTYIYIYNTHIYRSESITTVMTCLCSVDIKPKLILLNYLQPLKVSFITRTHIPHFLNIIHNSILLVLYIQYSYSIAFAFNFIYIYIDMMVSFYTLRVFYTFLFGFAFAFFSYTIFLLHTLCTRMMIYTFCCVVACCR